MLRYLALIIFCLIIVVALFYAFRLKFINVKAQFWTFAVGVFSMVIFNTYLTSLPIVMYNTSSILGIYISSFPIEDFGYLIAVTILTPALFEHFINDEKRITKQEKDRPKS